MSIWISSPYWPGEFYPTGEQNRQRGLKTILTDRLPLWAKEFNNNDSEVDYRTKTGFMNKFAYFILCSPKDEIQAYLQPFIDTFTNSKDMADLFQEFISVEDVLNHYDEFWIVWNAFYDCVVKVFKKQGSRYYLTTNS